MSKREKVYSVDNYWDMTIIEGIADFNNQPHYYANIFSEEQSDWTDEYWLTPLSKNIFVLGKEIWSYWLYWLETCNETKIPHPLDYVGKRTITSFKSLIILNANIEEWAKAEQNFQNQLVFDHYLETHIPIIKAKGVFSGKIDGTETYVEWTKDK